MASNKEEGEATTDLKQHEENGTKSNDKEESSSIHLKKVSKKIFYLVFTNQQVLILDFFKTFIQKIFLINKKKTL